MWRAFWFIAAIILTVPAAHAGPVTDCSRAEADGTRTLCVEAFIDGGVEQVWALWSQSEQLQTWLAPVAANDLRPGGMMEVAYSADGHIGDPANILNRVVSVMPMESFSIQVARAPPGFPHPNEVGLLTTLIEFAPEGAAATRVRVSMRGFGQGPAFDELYAFFERGNTWTIQKLSERVTQGPVDWRAAAAE
jgi:uncharacterized protein YndB with AHSA1/START domain